jgi:uncharacterized protein DUF2188/CopG antitoxin of type II toxin-antitoxin system
MSDKPKPVDPIPEEFASYEEAAAFWEVHDTTDYPEAFETVRVDAKLEGRRFEVELDQDLVSPLAARARQRGVAVGRLVNEMVRDKVGAVGGRSARGAGATGTQKRARREVIEVLPNRQGGWDVKRQGGNGGGSHHTLKAEAVAEARERAKAAELGQVRVRGRDGRIQTEWTYGKDPRSRPG